MALVVSPCAIPQRAPIKAALATKNVIITERPILFTSQRRAVKPIFPGGIEALPSQFDGEFSPEIVVYWRFLHKINYS
jgi:hypothetical protein